MASIASSLYNKKRAKQPVFDFHIPKFGGNGNDFYLNTHGVSVANMAKSYTSLADGYFYVLNKNNQPIYFDGVYLLNAKFRNETSIPAQDLKVTLNTTGTTYSVDGSVKYDSYIVKFRNKEIGNLTISSKTVYENGSLYLVNPFQSLKFGATYAVSNVGLLDTQYYGRTTINKDKNIGTIDINLSVICWKEKEKLSIIRDTITVTINLINTGYESYGAFWFGY
jgi:hypothetical protein